MEKVEKLEVPDKKAHLHHEPIHHAVAKKKKMEKTTNNYNFVEFFSSNFESKSVKCCIQYIPVESHVRQTDV